MAQSRVSTRPKVLPLRISPPLKLYLVLNLLIQRRRIQHASSPIQSLKKMESPHEQNFNFVTNYPPHPQPHTNLTSHANPVQRLDVIEELLYEQDSSSSPHPRFISQAKSTSSSRPVTNSKTELPREQNRTSYSLRTLLPRSLSTLTLQASSNDGGVLLARRPS